MRQISRQSITPLRTLGERMAFLQGRITLAASLLVAGTLLCGQAPATAQSTAASAADPLLNAFQNPPQIARPRAWWHWMNGNVDVAGAKLDLAWMARVGVGGVHTFSGGLPGPVVVAKPQPFMSDGWREAFRETTQIANGLGMEVGVAGSPGWSQTGGVWVAPTDGMKKYVWSETLVEGGRPFTGKLAAPPTAIGHFQGIKSASRARQLKGDVYADALVVAFPTPEAEAGSTPAPTYRTSGGSLDVGAMASAAPGPALIVPVASGEDSAWIEARYPHAVTVMAVTVDIPSGAEVEVQARDPAGDLRTIARALVEPEGALHHPLSQQTLAFPAATAQVFRVLFKPLPPAASLVGPANAPPPSRPTSIKLGKVVLETGARVNRFEAKAGFQSSISVDDVATPPTPARGVVDGGRVLDLTARLRPDGSLDWSPPPGRWTVLRYGWSLTGQTNGPAELSATGLEVDKLDAAAVRRYLDAYLALYETTGAKLGPNGVQTLLTDSWEAGAQNWTPQILAEFRRRRGYDPVRFAPVLAGRVVDSAERSDRFLWDFRQTLKDLVADNHYGVLAQMLHDRGMQYYTEVNGDTPRAIADGMTAKARSDIPTAEYWYRPFAAGSGQPSLKADLEEAASAAHVYGKPLVAAEALTVAAPEDPWAFSPAMLKPVADEIFARGVNRILMHDSHHQPLVDAKPGLKLFIFGQFFNRNDTWAEDARPWVDYLARTSYMLQQGRYVADVAYFYGEDKTLSELFRDRFNTDVPEGYRYDYINPEALMTLLSVKDGRLVTPSGMSYRALFLPAQVTRLTLPAARKLRALVNDGAVLVGPKPVGGLGLESPDEEIRRIADELWGEGAAASGRPFGKGRVYGDLAKALAAEKVAPDVAFANRQPDSQLLTLHRRTEDADIYFVSNQQPRAETVEATFRVSGKAPELWRAETGVSEALSYRQAPNGVTVPLMLAPHEAVFVVFRRAAEGAAWEAPPTKTGVLTTLQGPWTVSFEPGRGAPATATLDKLTSWTGSADPGVKYFSGSGTYSRTVTVKRGWLKRGRRVLLDLGEVRELATVTINGRPVGTSWHAPHRLDITDALRPGKNQLEIRVVNLWPNRLIGDKQPGAKPIAVAPQSPYRADSPLLPSGLLGPVTLVSVARE